MPTRRHILLTFAFALVAAGCPSREERCAQCGMKVDPSSAWSASLGLADGSTKQFDTPRCALTAWRTGKVDAVSLRAQDYYDRRWHDGNELAFIVGSDVLGPMGADVVPVDPSRAAKFAEDHGAPRPLTLREVTAELLSQLR